MMEKGISLGVVTAMNIEREGFLEALILHNNLVNKKTEIKEVFHPSSENKVYETQLFFENPNQKKGIDALNVSVMTNKAMGVVSATRCTMDLLNFMEMKHPSCEKLLAMSGICGGSSTHHFKTNEGKDKKLQMCDVIVADPVFLINETPQEYLEKNDDHRHHFWFTDKRYDENYLRKHPNDKFGILSINKELQHYLKSHFFSDSNACSTWRQKLASIDAELQFKERLEKASTVASAKRGKTYPQVRGIDAVLTAMGTTDRVRSDGGNVFREASITVPDTMAIDMESFAVYRTTWMWDQYQRSLKLRKYEARNGPIRMAREPLSPLKAMTPAEFEENYKKEAEKIKKLEQDLHKTTHRICVKAVVDFADESIDEEFYDVASKAAGSWVCDLAKSFYVHKENLQTIEEKKKKKY